MSKPVIILGAGPHSLVLIDILKLLNHEIIGAIAPNIRLGDRIAPGIKVLGDDSAIKDYASDSVKIVNGIGPKPYRTLRNKVSQLYESQGYQFSNVIHPNAVIADSATIREGAQVMAGVVIQSNAKIGKNSVINTGAIVDHNCQIDDEVHLAPGAVLCGGVSVGKNSYIGCGSIVIENIIIGENSILGAGSTLMRNMADKEKSFGLLK